MPGWSTDIDKPLTEKMKRFCEEYVKCGIVKEAYRRAFDTEPARASSLFYNPRCQKYIAELRELEKMNTVMSIQECYELLADIARNTEDELTKDRLKAIEIVMKGKGAFVEKKEVKISDSIDLEVSLESKSEAE